jgi:hypothetical protein
VDSIVILYTILCVWACTYMVRYTDGPFDIFWELRRKLNISWYANEDTDGFTEYADEDTGFFGSLVTCWICLSFWFSVVWGIVAVAFFFLPPMFLPVFCFASVTICAGIQRSIHGSL